MKTELAKDFVLFFEFRIFSRKSTLIDVDVAYVPYWFNSRHHVDILTASDQRNTVSNTYIRTDYHFQSTC